jgi:hypothetical protein
MAAITLGRGSTRQIERIIDRYAAQVPKAIARALNRAGTTTRAVMARAISQDVGMPVNQVRAQLRIEPATATRHVVRISVTGKRLPLIQFGAKGPRPSKGRGRGVTVRLRGGIGRHPHAFIIRVRGASGVAGGGTGDHEGVFIRKNVLARKSRGAWSKNLPIAQLHGPSLPKVFEKVSPAGIAAGQESLIKNLRHELRFALSGGGTTTTSS